MTTWGSKSKQVLKVGGQKKRRSDCSANSLVTAGWYQGPAVNSSWQPGVRLSGTFVALLKLRGGNLQ